ncbi:GNAT family N-acetyltransferase [Tessaracoccus antarcticus]|uniref:GNAT family N-acetyltransferase n=1 Tax=Tessaracoccus antarcticus TaxID=2479848 RepID=UPI0013146162|nr:GNAT family N-acetyltransferase [Tessaracoccus antarcticus]
MEAGEEREGAPPRLVHALTIRVARPDEWQHSRQLRLEMLADTPHSFGDRLCDVMEWDDDRWITRHESELLPDSAVFVAVEPDGRWVGQMAVREFHNYSPPRAWLMGVYVTPGHRGDGTATQLMEAVRSWTAERGFDQLFLDVHENAHPAHRFYERLGFIPTGHSSPYPLDPTTSELEMVTPIMGGGGARDAAGTPTARC